MSDSNSAAIHFFTAPPTFRIDFGFLFTRKNGYILGRVQKLFRFLQCLLHALLAGVIVYQIGLPFFLQVYRHGAIAECLMLQEGVRTHQQRGVGGLVIQRFPVHGEIFQAELARITQLMSPQCDGK